ncbi:MAG: hypothetical protein R8K46_07085 [Mariprofundaceae bacterium]
MRNYITSYRSKVKFDLFEGFGDVAAITLLAKSAVVDVILLMAGATDRRGFQPFLCWPGVAIKAVDLFMFAVQFEIGLLIVVEAPMLPAVRIVAGFATGSQS